MGEKLGSVANLVSTSKGGISGEILVTGVQILGNFLAVMGN